MKKKKEEKKNKKKKKKKKSHDNLLERNYRQKSQAPPPFLRRDNHLRIMLVQQKFSGEYLSTFMCPLIIQDQFDWGNRMEQQ